jgi:dTDP-4-dehydrorhamnose reductase
MTVLVLGSSGQVATHLRALLPDATFLGRASLDLEKPSGVTAAIEAMRPSAIINAAGYTAVDQAESEPAVAWRINAEAAAAAAFAATTLDVPLVHVSTNYVFDGSKTSEYVEDDPTNPLSVYGATKLAGELATRALCKKSWILRVGWVFSEHGANFVKTIVHLAATRDELEVVADQRGRPTYAGDLAALIAGLVQGPNRVPFGTYNAAGGSVVSWHEFADMIIEQAFSQRTIARRIPVRAITTSEYPTAARRPSNSVLKPNRALERASGIVMDWKKGLAATLAALNAF